MRTESVSTILFTHAKRDQETNMKKQIVTDGGRRKGKTFLPKYRTGSKKVQRTKKEKGG